MDQDESTDFEEGWTSFEQGGQKRKEWALNNDLSIE